MKPTLVGEQNPYGRDPYYALYPAPDGCAGHRLCCLILGMRRLDYLRVFDRVNLCEGPWSMDLALDMAAKLLSEKGNKLILLGRKVAAAFGESLPPFSSTDRVLLLPHPSGRCRIWNDAGIIEKTRGVVAQFLPELANLIGVEEAWL